MLSPIRPRFARFLLTAGLVAVAAPVLAQAARSHSMSCPDDHYSDRPTRCEIRTQGVPAAGELAVDATPNGGITLRGWDKPEIELRAKVVATADSEQEAASLLSRVHVLVDGGRVRAEGPERGDGVQWSASFELMVPSRFNADLTTLNGGISIHDVQGRLTFSTKNGGIALTNVNGDVRGSTTNGGVRVRLAGSGWIGEGLDVETKNGGVHLTAPEGYSAHLDAGTHNGGVSVAFPVTVQGRIGRTISTDLGNGGAPIRLRTINGGVSVERR